MIHFREIIRETNPILVLTIPILKKHVTRSETKLGTHAGELYFTNQSVDWLKIKSHVKGANVAWLSCAQKRFSDWTSLGRDA